MPSIAKVIIGAVLVVVGYTLLAAVVLSIFALALMFLIPGATAGVATPGYAQCISIAALGFLTAGVLALPNKK